MLMRIGGILLHPHFESTNVAIFPLISYHIQHELIIVVVHELYITFVHTLKVHKFNKKARFENRIVIKGKYSHKGFLYPRELKFSEFEGNCIFAYSYGVLS